MIPGPTQPAQVGVARAISMGFSLPNADLTLRKGATSYMRRVAFTLPDEESTNHPCAKTSGEHISNLVKPHAQALAKPDTVNTHGNGRRRGSITLPDDDATLRRRADGTAIDGPSTSTRAATPSKRPIPTCAKIPKVDEDNVMDKRDAVGSTPPPKAQSQSTRQLPVVPSDVPRDQVDVAHGGFATPSRNKGGQSTSDRVQAGQVTPKRKESTPSRNRPSLPTPSRVHFGQLTPSSLQSSQATEKLNQSAFVRQSPAAPRATRPTSVSTPSASGMNRRCSSLGTPSSSKNLRPTLIDATPPRVRSPSSPRLTPRRPVIDAGAAARKATAGASAVLKGVVAIKSKVAKVSSLPNMASRQGTFTTDPKPPLVAAASEVAALSKVERVRRRRKASLSDLRKTFK